MAPGADAASRAGPQGTEADSSVMKGALYAAPDLAARIGAQPVPGIAEGLVVTEIAHAGELLGTAERLTRLSLLPVQPLRQAPLESLGPYRLAGAGEGADLARLTDSFHLNLTAFGLLAFAVGLFVVHGTIGLAFEERRPLIRTLRALGVPLGTVALLMTAELLVLALIGGSLGVALGGWLAALLLPDVAETLEGLSGAEVPQSLTIRAGWWLSGLAMAAGGTMLAGGAALVQLARMPLLAAGRPRAWARAGAGLAVAAALAGLGQIAAAGAILVWGHGLWAGFAGLAALLLGAAALLPFLLSRLLALGAALSRGVVARWIWADTGQQLPGLSLALMALMLALAANIGVTAMVGSFRLTFTGYLDQRLAAELYVNAGSGAEAARLESWLAPRADAVLPIWRSRGQVSGMPVTLYGFRDHATYRESWPVLAGLPDLWDRAAAGEGVLVNEQMARRQGLSPGDRIGIEGWQAEVLGVYSDYGNPTGEVMMSLPRIAALPPPLDRSRLAIRVAPARAAALHDAMIEEFGLPPDAVVDQAGQKRVALAVFERTFLVTGALDFLTLGVAAFAMLTALVTLSGMRLPQLAPVWAMGLDRRRLAALEILRAVALAVLTWVLALPVGIALAWVLLAVINVEAFGWKLPLHLSASPMLGLLGGAVLAALLASLPSALRLARRPVGDLLRVFASAR